MPTIAGCFDCDWGPENDDNQPFQSYGQAKNAAFNHNEDTGHRAYVENVGEDY